MMFFAKIGAAIASLFIATFGSLGFLHQAQNFQQTSTTTVAASTGSISEDVTTTSADTLTIIYGTDGITPTDFAKDNSGRLYLNNGNGYQLVDQQAVQSDSALGMVDVNSFVAVDKWGGYMKDKNHVYIDTAQYFSVVGGADPFTFTILRDADGNELADYAKDKNHVYYQDKIIPDADPATFKKNSQDATFDTDATHVFAVGILDNETIVAGANPSVFTTLVALDGKPSDYGKDSSGIYCGRGLLPSADAASFVVDSESSAHDKNNEYDQCTVHNTNNS